MPLTGGEVKGVSCPLPKNPPPLSAFRASDSTIFEGQLSLASLRGRLIEYQLWLGQARECHLCRVAGNTVLSHMAREFP